MSSFPIVASEIKGAAKLTRADLNDEVTHFVNTIVQKQVNAKFGERLRRLDMIDKMVEVAGETAVIDLDMRDFAVIADHMRSAEDR